MSTCSEGTTQKTREGEGEHTTPTHRRTSYKALETYVESAISATRAIGKGRRTRRASASANASAAAGHDGGVSGCRVETSTSTSQAAWSDSSKMARGAGTSACRRFSSGRAVRRGASGSIFTSARSHSLAKRQTRCHTHIHTCARAYTQYTRNTPAPYVRTYARPRPARSGITWHVPPSRGILHFLSASRVDSHGGRL